MSTMIIYSQRDPKWASMKLGKSNQTLGKVGCTTTAVATGLTAFGFKTAPPDLAVQDCYTPDGLTLWNWKLPGGFYKRARIQGRNDAAILASLKDPDEFVILQVANGSHWVLATSKTMFGNSFNVADPWFADRCDVIKRYGNITGSCHFSRK